MIRPLSRLIVIVTLAFCVSTVWAQDSYLEHIESTIVQIEKGDYNRAAESLRKAITLDANEPLAHLCLAVIYGHAGQPEQAALEYKVALGYQKDDSLALYGLAIALLGRPDTQGALQQLQKIKGDSGIDAQPVLAYLRALSGEYRAAAEQVAALPDAASVQLRAAALFKAGKYPEAKEAMSELVKVLPSKGYSERPGTVMTFDPRVPVKSTGGQLSKPIVPPAVEAAAAPKVTGSVRLKADLKRAPNVKFVTFYADEQMVALVNHPPYEYSWDTTRYSNGLHTLRIQGQTADNQIVNQRSMKVRVENRGAKPHIMTGVDVDALRARLWDRIKLWPSLAAAQYMLAKCAVADGDKAGQIEHLEKVMAAAPDYLDTVTLLKQAYGKVEKYRELRNGSASGAKTIALTFDDGPNPQIGPILDLLAAQGVKATFFIVGQNCENDPEMLERIHRGGHGIGNHTYGHRNLEYLTVPEIEKELFKTSAILHDLIGAHTILFRPPGGHLTANGKKVASDFGLLPVFWTVNSSRYEGTTADTVARYVNSAVTPGGIVLMHSADNISLAALPAVISGLKAKGYQFVTVSEMFFGR